MRGGLLQRMSSGRGGGGEVSRPGRMGADEGFPRGRNSVVGVMRGLEDLIVVLSLGSLGFV